MSLLIKNMEMPKDRPVCIVIDAAGQARRYDLNNDRYADDKLYEAVPVPPHGDLINKEYAIATACSGLIRTFPTTENGEDWIRVKEVRESLKNAPIVIPADKEDDKE